MRDTAANRRVGDEAAADAEPIWSATQACPVYQRPGGGSWIDLVLAVPGDACGTSSWGTRPTRWLLSVEIPTPGPDFRTTFPVPIYARAR